MKIAITSTGKNLDNQLDLHFGRAFGFIIYDTETEKFEFLINQNLNAAQGAGIQTAQDIVNKDVQVVITGNCGPKAFTVLNTAKIKVYFMTDGSIKEVIKKFKCGELQEATSAKTE